MNFALPAIVLFAVLLPGFVARSRLKIVERTTIDHSPFGYAVTEGIILAAVLHITWIAGVECFSVWSFSPEKLFLLLSSNPDLQGKALQELGHQFRQVSSYFLSLILFSFFAPTIFRKIVEVYRLDAYDFFFSRMLRFTGAPWYYLLSGAGFEKKDLPDLIVISAIVNVAGDPFLYVGVLEEYFVDQEGNLDRVVLSDVIRRPFSKDKKSPQDVQKSERFYKIDGDYFVLRYSEAITLNVQYIKLEPAGE